VDGCKFDERVDCKIEEPKDPECIACALIKIGWHLSWTGTQECPVYFVETDRPYRG